jgi:hypothetical protein
MNSEKNGAAQAGRTSGLKLEILLNSIILRLLIISAVIAWGFPSISAVDLHVLKTSERCIHV